MKLTLYSIILLITTSIAVAQVENVPLSNPVYDFITYGEAIGYLPHFTTTNLPWSRSDVVKALKLIKDEAVKNNHTQLINSLASYEAEFELKSTKQAVIFYSATDSLQVISNEFFGSDEKGIYRYSTDDIKVNIKPLGSMEVFADSDDRTATVGTLGIRMFGTLDNSFGYYLQATNGRVVSGDRELALLDPRYTHSIKFTQLNDDIDLTESHVAYQKKWFRAEIGRETRLIGSGLNQRLYINDIASAYDAITLSANFESFKYSFTHGSLLGIADTYWGTGFTANIPNKYMAMHSFALTPSWGEIGFLEQVIYSRNVDLAYLNPLSFFKSVEHSQHDRDNSLMGLYTTVRPFSGLQLKGSYLLDDIRFELINTGYWSNKSAWNIAAMYALPYALYVGAEYSKVEPYTYSHFNVKNSVTHDTKMLGSIILPNSDQIGLNLSWYGAGRYPLKLRLAYTRHGNNIYSGDSLVYNAGGDPLQTRRVTDKYELDFLEGDVDKQMDVELNYGYEFIRGFSVHATGLLRNFDGNSKIYARFVLRFEDF